MSHCNGVLDSWEEIDEAGLNSQLNQLKRDMIPATSNGMPMQNGAPIMLMMRPPDNHYGNSYTQPPKPSVTILRRPSQQQNNSITTDVRPKPPLKTLKQREQEYAEARLRILGSAKNPEDEIDVSIPTVATKVSDVEDENYTQININDSYSYSFNLNGLTRPYDNDVLRLPRGPDGSSGFNLRR